MKTFLVVCTLFISLYASNPNVYATLGDVIYNNAPKIEKLKNFDEYAPFKERIDTYIKDVNETKKLGFAIEDGIKKGAAKEYLKRLRTLAKTNDFFSRSAKALFENALKNGDFNTLMDILDTGLIDTQRNKKRLLEFWEERKGSFVPRGEFLRIVQEEELKKNSKNTKEYYEKLRKMREREKIRRLREKDKKRQEELQRRLEEELKRKKEQIEKKQVEELQQDTKF